jgi:lipoyl-dependent peroxiredoxin subunit D
MSYAPVTGLWVALPSKFYITPSLLQKAALMINAAFFAFENENQMSIDALRDLIPDYAKDISLNLSSLASEQVLSDQQKWGAFLACAYAIGVPQVVKHIEVTVTPILSPEALTAAKAAAAIMGMNNVYYRALHLMENQEYATLPAKLRMNIIANPGVDKVDFELWSLAVSAVNGCGLCLDSHEKVLRSHGITNVQLQAGLRIAATVNAISAVIRGETAAKV